VNMEIYEIIGKDKKTKQEFYVGWSLNKDHAVELKTEAENSDLKKAYEYYIKYPSDKAV
jgi:hypothetical protein